MKTLRKGSRGEQVNLLQAALSESLGFDLVESGKFDASTKRAVMAHQQRSIGPDGLPLSVDGVVGDLTWWSLLTLDQTAAFHTQTTAQIGDPPHELAAKTLAAAIGEARAGAMEIGANNAGEFVEKYLRGKTGAWCAGFASWCIHEAGGTIPYKTTAKGLLREFEKRGLTYDPNEREPMAGDLIFWWRVAPDSWQGHVEIVAGYADGVIWTIGGNRGAFPAPVRQFSYVLSRESKFIGLARLPEQRAERDSGS